MEDCLLLRRHWSLLLVSGILVLSILACAGLSFDSDDSQGLPTLAFDDDREASSEAAVVLDTTPAPTSAYTTLEALRQTVIPIRDKIDLAQRLDGLPPVSALTPIEPRIYQVGDVEVFWADNTDTDEVLQVRAVLQYITPHVYMWIDEDDNFNPADLAAAAELFENNTYPITRRYFGSESTPGIDGDEHLSVLHTSKIGRTVAGYYSSQSQYPAAASQYSNEREMFFINIGNTRPGDGFYDGVLAHEFQHMIHWNVDRNEDSWVNEGMSELSVLLNGFDVTGSERSFVINTDLQLTDWPEGDGRGANYAASFLFHTYFVERFGDEVLQELVRSPFNGFNGVDDTLSGLSIIDPLTDQPITGIDFFADWTVANLVDDSRLADGRYTYDLLPDFRSASLTTVAARLPTNETTTVHQFGTDYIQVPAAETLRIIFDGSQVVQVLPVFTFDTDGDPASDDFYVWWSNRGDDSNMRLTTPLDLTGVQSATLEYDTWYWIEENWDYAYVEISQDGGLTWDILETPYTTTENPHGTGFGTGYTGVSAERTAANADGWLHESIDLGAYTGSEVLLRFEMVTDDAVNQPGLALDNIRVDAIGFYDDVESGTDLWEAEGFVRIDNLLPQRFVVQVIALGPAPTVTRLELSDNNHGQLDFQPGPDATEVILVISGVTPYTNEIATYTYSVTAQ